MHRDFMRSILAIAGMVAATVPVSAQVRVENGVVIRADLKASIPASSAPAPVPAPAYVAATSASAPSSSASAPSKRCDVNSVCQTPLLVSQGGLDKALKWDPDGCSVYWPYSDLRVKGRWQPTLRWVLVSDPTDPTKYEFDRTYGIELFGNDQAVGLSRGYREPSGTAFIWTNLNLKPAAIRFQPNVHRLDKSGKAVPCNVADPFVVNEN